MSVCRQDGNWYKLPFLMAFTWWHPPCRLRLILCANFHEAIWTCSLKHVLVSLCAYNQPWVQPIGYSYALSKKAFTCESMPIPEYRAPFQCKDFVVLSDASYVGLLQLNAKCQ